MHSIQPPIIIFPFEYSLILALITSSEAVSEGSRYPGCTVYRRRESKQTPELDNVHRGYRGRPLESDQLYNALPARKSIEAVGESANNQDSRKATRESALDCKHPVEAMARHLACVAQLTRWIDEQFLLPKSFLDCSPPSSSPCETGHLLTLKSRSGGMVRTARNSPQWCLDGVRRARDVTPCTRQGNTGGKLASYALAQGRFHQSGRGDGPLGRRSPPLRPS